MGEWIKDHLLLIGGLMASLVGVATFVCIGFALLQWPDSQGDWIGIFYFMSFVAFCFTYTVCMIFFGVDITEVIWGWVSN